MKKIPKNIILKSQSMLVLIKKFTNYRFYMAGITQNKRK